MTLNKYQLLAAHSWSRYGGQVMPIVHTVITVKLSKQMNLYSASYINHLSLKRSDIACV